MTFSSHFMSLQLRIGPRILPKNEVRTLKRKASLTERETKPRFPYKQWIRSPDATTRQNGHKWNASSSDNVEQAQILLDDLASSMRPSKIPKIEPVEPSLADVSFSVTYPEPALLLSYHASVQSLHRSNRHHKRSVHRASRFHRIPANLPSVPSSVSFHLYRS
jgi:hypothetical protein